MSFANFKKLFASNRFFLEVPNTEREAELKKIHKKLKSKSARVSKTNNKRKDTNAK